MPTAKPTNNIETLRRVAIFADLSEAELQFLAERAVPRDFETGDIVFSEGEPCAGLFVVETGALRIFKSSPSGREQVLSVEGPGSSVAELPVFDGGNYPASTSAAQAHSRTVRQQAGFLLALPGAPEGRAEGVEGGGLATATTGRHHRRAVVYDGAVAPDFLSGANCRRREEDPARYRSQPSGEQPGVGVAYRNRPRTWFPGI